MGVFIINEWLWSDIQGENEDQGPRQMQAALFLGAFLQSAHKLVMVEDSKFAKKAFMACKSVHQGVKHLGVIFLKLRLDSDRCCVKRPQELKEIPHKLAASVNIDDHYLVRALLTVEGSILVTHDEKLRRALAEAGLSDRYVSREEFLKKNFNID